MTKAMTYEEFVEYAKKYYNNGGDTYYECWGQREFDEYVKEFGPMTKSKALSMFRTNYDIEREYFGRGYY